jgi:hypothetical protein
VNPPSHLVILQVDSEYWVLNFTLPPPELVDSGRKFEVTSVNWESQLAGATASVALVSYKWHGIMYAIESKAITIAIQSHFALGAGM